MIMEFRRIVNMFILIKQQAVPHGHSLRRSDL